MKVNYFLLVKCVFAFIFTPVVGYSEPFVVLEYRHNLNDVDIDHPFIADQNFSLKHKVKKNETLTEIIQKYYGFKHFNREIISLSIVHYNKRAFVRKNPNFLFAGKTLYLPSLNEIKNIVLKLPKNKNVEESFSTRKSQIYFFGG